MKIVTRKVQSPIIWVNKLMHKGLILAQKKQSHFHYTIIFLIGILAGLINQILLNYSWIYVWNIIWSTSLQICNLVSFKSHTRSVCHYSLFQLSSLPNQQKNKLLRAKPIKVHLCRMRVITCSILLMFHPCWNPDRAC